MASRWSLIFGRSQTTTASTFATSQPVADDAARLAKKAYGVGVLPFGVGVGEVVADVFEAGRAEEGVGDDVGQNVGVGVAQESPIG
jgi:hypothetical protein